MSALKQRDPLVAMFGAKPLQDASTATLCLGGERLESAGIEIRNYRGVDCAGCGAARAHLDAKGRLALPRALVCSPEGRRPGEAKGRQSLLAPATEIEMMPSISVH